MKTVKIYAVNVTRAMMACELGAIASLEPWNGNNRDYEGEDDGGKDYILPDGYSVSESYGAGKQIYNAANRACALHRVPNGSVQLIDDEKTIFLKQA